MDNKSTNPYEDIAYRTKLFMEVVNRHRNSIRFRLDHNVNHILAFDHARIITKLGWKILKRGHNAIIHGAFRVAWWIPAIKKLFYGPYRRWSPKGFYDANGNCIFRDDRCFTDKFAGEFAWLSALDLIKIENWSFKSPMVSCNQIEFRITHLGEQVLSDPKHIPNLDVYYYIKDVDTVCPENHGELVHVLRSWWLSTGEEDAIANDKLPHLKRGQF